MTPHSPTPSSTRNTVSNLAHVTTPFVVISFPRIDELVLAQHKLSQIRELVLDQHKHSRGHVAPQNQSRFRAGAIPPFSPSANEVSFCSFFFQFSQSHQTLYSPGPQTRFNGRDGEPLNKMANISPSCPVRSPPVEFRVQLKLFAPK